MPTVVWRKSLQSRATVRAISLAFGLAATACTTLGTLKQRADQVNIMSAEYASSAILYNVLRSASAEPLEFVSLTAVTGHGTATANIGLPSVTLGPLANKIYTFGPNGVSGSEADDFNMSVVDDPASFAALSKPIDPATIGYLINQLYNRDAILYLAISRMDVKGQDGKTTLYFNEPLVIPPDKSGPSQMFRNFVNQLQWYLKEGLTATVDQGYVPQPNKTANAALCFDPEIDTYDHIGIQQASSFAWYKGGTRHKGGTNAPTPCPSQDKLATAHQWTSPLPAPLGSRTQVVQINVSGSGGASSEKPTVPNWSFTDPLGKEVHVYTRSVLGIYRYLGELVRVREMGGWTNFPDADSGVFNGGMLTDLIFLSHDNSDCWVSTEYRHKHWCIPEATDQTKRTFQLLHQLFELYATPANQTVTPTVRTTP